LQLLCLRASPLFGLLDLLALLLFSPTQCFYFSAHLAFSRAARLRFFFRFCPNHFQGGKMMLLFFSLATCFFFKALALFFSTTTRLLKSLSFFLGAPASLLFRFQSHFFFRTQTLLLRDPQTFLFFPLASGLRFRAMTFEFQRR